LQDETINEMINQCAEADIQVEEINIASAGSVMDVEEIILDEVPAVDSLVTCEPHDLPRRFAGPAPELSASAALKILQAGSRTNASSGHNVFPFDQQSVDDETIIITAPFEIYDPSVEIPAAGQQTRTAPGENFTPHRNLPSEDNATTNSNNDIHAFAETADITRPEAMDEPVTARQPGILRRLCSTLVSLFRRSRQPG
jgi:hypothetical protein